MNTFNEKTVGLRSRRDLNSITSSGTSFLNYWLGKALKRVKQNFLGLQAGNACFTAPSCLRHLFFLDKNPDTQWNNTNTKDLYTLFANSTLVIPKILTNNILPNPKVSLSYLSSPILSPPTKEHLFSPSMIFF